MLLLQKSGNAMRVCTDALVQLDLLAFCVANIAMVAPIAARRQLSRTRLERFRRAATLQIRSQGLRMFWLWLGNIYQAIDGMYPSFTEFIRCSGLILAVALQRAGHVDRTGFGQLSAQNLEGIAGHLW